MITLHRLNQQEFVLNADLIETLESTPDTLVTLTTGKKMIVRDTLLGVVARVVAYRQLCHSTVQVVQTENRETPTDDVAAATDVPELNTINRKNEHGSRPR
jgi:flagellar protein FlbD